MLVGYSLSGKNTLTSKIVKKFPKSFFVLSTRSIHDYLNTNEIFQDDYSVEGESYKLREECSDAIGNSLLTVLGKHNLSVISNSCNQVQKERKERIDTIKNLIPDLQTVILFVNPKEEVLLKRIKKEDDALREQSRKPVWEELYKKQITRMEVPTKEEADVFIEYNCENDTEVLESLGKIIN